MSGKPAARITDSVSGGKIVSGSRTVLIGSQGGIACSECPGGVTVGNPVSPSLGAKVLMAEPELDFALPGAMPLVWQRQYSSYVNPEHGAPCGLLGHGWSLPAQMHVELRDDACILFTSMGRVITFDPLPEGGSVYSPSEDIWLMRGAPDASWRALPRFRHIPHDLGSDPHRILAAHGDGQTAWSFKPAPAVAGASQAPHTSPPAGTPYALQCMLDRFGRRQRYERDAWGRITAIVDGVGRRYGLNLRQLYPARPAQGLWLADSGWRLTGVDLLSDPWVPGASEPIPLVRYGYSEAGDLLTVHDRAGRLVREFAWQAHLMTAHRHLGGPRHSYRYERLAPGARVIEHANEQGLAYRFEYDRTDTGKTTRVTDSLQRVDIYRFEGAAGLSRLVEHVRADGTTVRYAYDSAGRMVQAVDPLGRTTRLRYDGEGRLLGSHDADGTRSSQDHDPATGRLLAITDAAGSITRFVYDRWGRRTQTVWPDGSVERDEYPAPEDAPLTCDLPERRVDARGGIVQFAWNPAGQLVRYTDCSGHASETEYDRWGQRIRHTDPLGQSVLYEYDFAGDLRAVHRADGHTIRYSRDAAGRVTQRQPAEQQPDHVAGFAYDLWGRITRRWQGGHDVQYEYDAAGRLIRLTNENGAHARFEWDAMDRQVCEEGFDGRQQTYRYDAAGQLVETTDGTAADSLHTHYAWDAMGRLVEIHVPATAHAPARIERLQWNAAGQLVAMRSYLLGPGPLQQLHTEALTERDALGRPTSETQRLYRIAESAAAADAPIPSSPEIEFEHTISHHLDALGHRQASELQDLGKVDFLLYGSGHLHGLLYNGRSLLDIERDALHRETRRQQRLHEEADVLVTQRRWDALGRLEDVQVEGARRGQAADAIPSHLLGQWRQRHYRYAAAGQLAALQTAGGDVHYRYDAPGRLIGALSADGEQRWPFDPAGNRLPSLPEEYSQGPAPGPIRDTDGWAAQVRSQWFDSGFDVLGLHGATPALPSDGVARWHGNRIGCSEDATYLYDSRGNRTQAMHANGRRLLMHYDGANRLVEVQMFDQQASYVCSYTYDAHGRRLRKTVRERAHPLAEVQESRTCYGWDGDRRVGTQHWRPGGDKQTTHTIYEPGSFTPLIQLEMVDAASTGAPAAQTTGRQAQQALGDAFKNLPTDIRRNMEDLLQQAVARALPSPIIVRHYHCDALGTPQALTDEHGDPVWMARPDPWGNLQEEYNPHGIDQPIRLPGQHHDAETGLHYNRHRYYDPRPGTYVNQDPIGLQGGPNPYSYAANPLEWIDPLGLNPAGCAVGASIGVWGGGVGAVPGCAIGAGVGTALVLGAVALGLSGDTPQHSNTAAKTDSWGVPIDPKADTLSQAHKNAISRTSPGYGGNCSPDEYDRLHDDYKQKCGQSDRLGACTSGMSPSQLSARRQAFGQCARAREEIMNQCFAGGDYNHRQQAGNVWNAYKNCAGTP